MILIGVIATHSYCHAMLDCIGGRYEGVSSLVVASVARTVSFETWNRQGTNIYPLPIMYTVNKSLSSAHIPPHLWLRVDMSQDLVST